MLFVDPGNRYFAWALPAILILGALFPTMAAVAILRHRLYDIDRLISRTVTYTVLTVVLGAIYAAVVVLLGQAVTSDSRDSTLAVAAATLVAAALFGPLRRRIQQRVDRRFNRRRYDAAKTMQAFSLRLRSELDLDTVSSELLGVVDETVQPTRRRRCGCAESIPPSTADDDGRPRSTAGGAGADITGWLAAGRSMRAGCWWPH
jgi:hypothetical protein